MPEGRDLPPVIELLINEDFDGIHTGAGLERTLKHIRHELHRQAEWTHSNYRYLDAPEQSPVDQFLLRTSGGLDPFSTVEVCGNLTCRVRTAEQFARTAGVLADRLALPDVFTSRFASGDEMTAAQTRRFVGDIVTLDRLKPLIRAGIVKFTDGRIGFCEHHDQEAYERVAVATTELLSEVEPELKFERSRTSVCVRTGSLLNPPMSWTRDIKPSDQHKSTRELGLEAFKSPLRRDLTLLMRDMRSAQRMKASLASGSRLGLLAIRHIERRAPNIADLEQWETMRSVPLPWVRNLSPAEVVNLREEASIALPRLRTLLQAKLASESDDSDGNVADLVAELRAEAAEVEAELGSLKLARERGFRTLTGGLGLSIAIYGLATGVVAPAVGLGSLLSLLGLIHAAERNDEKQHDHLTSRPGYVLLKARELIHRH